MKKTFSLREPGKADARVIESVKNDVRKYVQRERRKTLPTDFDRWEFRCQVGATPEAATPCTVPELSARIDAVANAGVAQVYVEILAVPAHRAPPNDSADGGANDR